MNNLKDKELSHSRLELYRQCPYAFYLRYIVDDDDQYLNENNFYAELGSYVHLILEKIFKGELDVDDALEYYIEHYEDNVLYETWESVMSKSYELCADYFAEVDFDWLKDYEILGVENEIHTEVSGYKFRGFIDLLLRHKETGDIYVIDHKSSAYPMKKNGKSPLKSEEKNFEKYKRQMYLYSKAVYDEYGEYPKYIVWNHFKDKKILKIPFDMEEYENTLIMIEATIHAIEKDDEFPAMVDYFFCHQLCNFRSSCEYANDEDEE